MKRDVARVGMPVGRDAIQAMLRDGLANGNPNAVPRESCACRDPDCDGRWRVDSAGGPDVACPLWQRQQRVAAHGVARVEANADLVRYARTWSEIMVEHPAWEFVREVCSDVRGLLVEPGLSLVFTGPRGTGKSQAGVMLVRAAAASDLTARYVPWPAWWNGVKSRFGSADASDAVADLVKPDVLVVDEVGASLDERSTYAWALLEAIVGGRYDAGRPIVLSTNLTMQRLAVASSGYTGERAVQVEERVRTGALTLDALPSRLYSRLQHTARPMVFDGRNFRAEQDAPRRDAAVAAIEARLRSREVS